MEMMELFQTATEQEPKPKVRRCDNIAAKW